MVRYHGCGTITKEYKTLKPKRDMCSGCHDIIYDCWSFESAKVVDKEVYTSIYALKPRKIKKTLSCYHGINK